MRGKIDNFKRNILLCDHLLSKIYNNQLLDFLYEMIKVINSMIIIKVAM
ncbi:hypothetical protein EMIT036CA2_10278 [Chryseobacterium sp. IT-36CA2]